MRKRRRKRRMKRKGEEKEISTSLKRLNNDHRSHLGGREKGIYSEARKGLNPKLMPSC